MANTHETLTSLFTATADAIRAKTGSTNAIVADNFPTAIREIISPTTFTIPKGRMKGDVNGDGAITMADATLIIQESSSLTDEIQIWCADTNGSGVINATDAAVIRNYINGTDAITGMADYYSNWTYNSEADNWYVDISAANVTTTTNVVIIIDAKYDHDFFQSAECLDGIIRIYAKACPITDVSAQIICEKNGTGTVTILVKETADTPIDITIPKGRMKGDVDGDGAITEADGSLILASQVGAATLDEIQTWCGDVNNDGSVSAYDASLITQHLSNIDDTLISNFVDYYGDWTYDSETDGWYTDISISGISTITDALVIVNGSHEFNFFRSALCLDGTLRIYAKACPLTEVSAQVIIEQNGSGKAFVMIKDTTDDVFALRDNDIFITIPSDYCWCDLTYGLGKIVAIMDDYKRIAYSLDGITWDVATALSDHYWSSIAYGNGMFVIVAQDTNVSSYSIDGITWSDATMPSTSSWNSVAYGDGKFVAISKNSNAAAYSTDGINWTATTMPSSSVWESIAYGNGKFVSIVYGSNVVAYSTDGIDWAESALPSSLNWKDVIYGEDKFVAIAPGNNAAYSTDGINWTSITMPDSIGWYSIAYANGTFVTVANNSNIAAYSTDGINWTSTSMPSSGLWRSVAYGPGRFVAIQYDYNGENIVAISTEGINWTSTITEGKIMDFNDDDVTEETVQATGLLDSELFLQDYLITQIATALEGKIGNGIVKTTKTINLDWSEDYESTCEIIYISNGVRVYLGCGNPKRSVIEAEGGVVYVKMGEGSHYSSNFISVDDFGASDREVIMAIQDGEIIYLCSSDEQLG